MSFELEHPNDERFYIENIEPLIVNVDQRGPTLEFRFQCPLTDYQVSAKIRPGTKPQGNRPAKPGLYGLLENALRPTTSSEESPNVDYPLADIEEAACDAFESVSQEFLWDGTRWSHWEADDRVIEFLKFSETLDDFDTVQRLILRQVLEAIAAADGRVDASESQLLMTLLGTRGVGAQDKLPSVKELRSLKTRSQACALVCFGYAVACVDGELSESEEDRLSVICDALGLGTLKQWELKRIAQSFVIDEAFSRICTEGKPSNEERLEVYKFGKGLGLSVAELRELEWRFRKRTGL